MVISTCGSNTGVKWFGEGKRSILISDETGHFRRLARIIVAIAAIIAFLAISGAAAGAVMPAEEAGVGQAVDDAAIEESGASSSQSAAFQVSFLQSSYSVEEGEVAYLDVNVTEVNEISGTQNITFRVEQNGEVLYSDTKTVSLGAGESKIITFSWDTSGWDPATYDAIVESFDDTDLAAISVQEAPPEATLTIETPLYDRDAYGPFISIYNHTSTVYLEFDNIDNDAGPQTGTISSQCDDARNCRFSQSVLGGYQAGDTVQGVVYNDSTKDNKLASDSVVIKPTATLSIDEPVLETDSQMTVNLNFNNITEGYLHVTHAGSETQQVVSEPDASVSADNFGGFQAGNELGVYLFEDQTHYNNWLEGTADPLDSQWTVVEANPPDFRVQSIDIPSKPVALSDPATVTAQIANVGGPGSQDVTLNVQGGSGDTRTLSLKMDESATITLEGQYDGGRTIEHTVSTANDSQSDSVWVGPKYVLESVDYPSSVSKGDEFEMTVTVSNQGAGSGGEVRMGAGEDVNTTDVEQLEFYKNSTVSLGYGESTSVTGTWDTSGTEPGTYEVAAATFDNRDVSLDAFFDEMTVLPEDTAPPSFDVTILNTTSPVDEGDPLTVTAEIHNTGEEPGEQTITLGVDGGVGQVDDQIVSLAGGATETVELTWSTGSGDGGVYTLEVASDDDAASTEGEVLLPETDAPRIQITSLNVPDEAVAGETIEFTSALKNSGGATATQDIGVTINGEEHDSIPVDLSPDEVTVIVSTWETAGASPGEYLVEFSSANDTRNKTLTLTGEDAGGEATPATFDVEILGTNSPVEAGNPVTVDVRVNNAGEQSGNQEIELAADGSAIDATAVDLAGGESTDLTLTWETEGVDAGTHELGVASENSSDSTEVTIGTPSIEVTIESVDYDEDTGTIHIVATVSNNGTLDALDTVFASAHGIEQDSREVQLAPGESQELSFSWDPQTQDLTEYEIGVESSFDRDEAIESFAISDDDGDGSDGGDGSEVNATNPALLVGVFLAGILLVYLYIRRRGGGGEMDGRRPPADEGDSGPE